jgi:hypothetical protein
MRWVYIASPVVVFAIVSLVRGLEPPDDIAVAGLLVGIALAAVTIGNRRYAVLVPGLAVISAAGVYLTTPDTERAIQFGVVMVLVALVSLYIPPAWQADIAAPALLLLAWVAATDGAPRASAVVGALGCAAALPMLRWAFTHPVVVVAAHAVAVLIAARVAGRQDDALVGFVIVAVDWAVLATVLVAVWPTTDNE